jgi:undecaprenyl diphosphate synthase
MTTSNVSEIASDQIASTDWFTHYGIRHVAIIPDGNRRWARQKSVPIEVGHSNGLLHVLPALVNGLCEAGVHTVTVWGFSTENWTREEGEVKYLMRLIAEFLRQHLRGIAQKHDARICHLGRKDRIYAPVRAALEAVEAETRGNRSHIYNVALDYGGQDELERASARMAAALRTGAARSDASLVDFLDTAGQPHPHPDVVIRSSGEQRTSGFLPLQSAYSELFFLEEMFPEFTFQMIQDVAEQFKWRKRRFGK